MIATAVAMPRTPPITTSRARIVDLFGVRQLRAPLISRVIGRGGRTTEAAGALQPGEELRHQRELPGSAPCWTSSRSIPPASQPTGASRWSPASWSS